jgi:4'-phosphopantetheinyl transferase EntD
MEQKAGYEFSVKASGNAQSPAAFVRIDTLIVISRYPACMVEPQVSIRYWDRANGEALPVFWTPFDVDAFAQTSFAAAGIDCPAHITTAVRKRQAEYFHGRLCARAALRHLGVPAQRLPTGQMREPIWPIGFVGSITHSRRLAAAIALPAAHHRGVGIDIEEVATGDALVSLKSVVVSDKEYAVVNDLDSADIGLLLTAVFSAKESFFKAVFGTVRRFFDFNALELNHVDMQTGTMSFTVQQALCVDFMPGCRLCIVFTILPTGEVGTLYAW